jgi:membrane protein
MARESEQHRPGDPSGCDATSPTAISARGWLAVLRRLFRAVLADRLGILSAGVAFYLFLSVFPALGVFVSIYGILVDRQEAAAQIDRLAVTMPADVRVILTQSAAEVAGRPGKQLGWGVVVSAVLGIWSAKKGANALFDGIGIAYNQQDQRGIVGKNLLTLMVTAVLMVGGLLTIGFLTLIPVVTGWLGMPGSTTDMVEGLRWPILAVLAVLIMGFLAWLYRIAPDRRDARWRWISPGSVVATLLWLAGSALFSWYFQSFGDLDKTFGAFGAAALLMLWLLLTAFVVLVGAELNAELEHHVKPDSTVPPDRPLGQRGAWVADHVASMEGDAGGPGASPKDRAE